MNRSYNLGQTTRPNDRQHKRKPAESRLSRPGRPQSKIDKSEMRDKYLYLAKELKKKLWNMKGMIIPIVIGPLGSIPVVFLKEMKTQK